MGYPIAGRVSVLVLLGPQRFQPTVAQTMADLRIEGSVAAVTAGWREREGEDQELRTHLDREVIDLRLYHRAAELLEHDRELGDALRDRQETLQELQQLYKLRLSYALDAARELWRRRRRSKLLGEQRRAAIRAVRSLDRWHLRRIRRIHDEFAERWEPTRRSSVARHREELQRILESVGVLCVAGGHVAVLLNRLRLFDLPPLVGDRPVIAWSAGAMAVSERVVLFHDSPPQGAGNPEVLDAGLALCRRLVALPHARSRLRLDDPVRVSLFARRFDPSTCALLEEGRRLDWDGTVWRAAPGTQALEKRGGVREIARA